MYEHIFYITIFAILCRFHSVKSLNYTTRNLQISNKMFITVLRKDSVWEREIMVDNLLFILISNNFPGTRANIYFISLSL